MVAGPAGLRYTTDFSLLENDCTVYIKVSAFTPIVCCIQRATALALSSRLYLLG